MAGRLAARAWPVPFGHGPHTPRTRADSLKAAPALLEAYNIQYSMFCFTL